MTRQIHPRYLLIPALALFTAACMGPADAAQGAPGDPVAAASAGEHDGHTGHVGALDDAGEAPLAEDVGSLQDLDVRWLDQTGAERTLADLGGRPLVMAMVYTSCAHTCPLILADLKQLEGALTQGQRDSVRFVLVSLDPARDTPERLDQFATDSRLDPDRWTLLTGDEMDVRTLAAALGVRYRPGAGEDIDHTNALTIVDPSGAIAYQQRGVGGGIDAPRRALTALLH